jgi:MFS family permease
VRNRWVANGTALRLDVVVLTNFAALGIVISAVPRYLHGVLAADRFHTGLATTVYFVAALLMRPFVGAAVDRIGRKWFIALPPIVTAILTLTYLRVHTVWGIALLRFVGGGVASLFFTAAALAATDVVAPEKRSQALGRQSVMTYSGFAVGPVITDRLLDHGWTVVWVVPACLHVLTALVAWSLQETKTTTSQTSSRAGFDRRVVRPSVGILVANFGFASIVAFLPEYCERLHISRPGALFATYAVCVLTVRGLTGRLADRIGPARFTVPTMLIGSVGLLALALANRPWISFVAIAIVGGSLGSTFPAAAAAGLQRVGEGDRGRAMGTALAVGDIGQASAGPLVGYVSTQLGFRWVYGIPAFLALIAVGIVGTMPEVRRRP